MRFKKDVFKAKLKLNFTIQNPEVSKVIWGLVYFKIVQNSQNLRNLIPMKINSLTCEI